MKDQWLPDHPVLGVIRADWPSGVEVVRPVDLVAGRDYRVYSAEGRWLEGVFTGRVGRPGEVRLVLGFGRWEMTLAEGDAVAAVAL